MGQQVSITELKEQIEAAKRSLAEMPPVTNAADPLLQPFAMPAANSSGVADGYECDAPDVLDQNMVANDDMATNDTATNDTATNDTATNDTATNDTAKNDTAKNDTAKNDTAKNDTTTVEDFQFFHRPKRSDRPFAPSSPVRMANADVSAHDDDQPLFQGLDQRLDRLEDDIARNRKHILELITLLSGLDMAAKPTRQNLRSAKYLLRRNVYWLVIGFLVISWIALTPSGNYWINHFLGLI